MKKKGKRNGTTATLISMLLIAVALVGFYFWQYNKEEDGKVETGKTSTEAQKLLNYDFETRYPQTPREVIKLYCRMLKCLYNNELTDDQVTQMADQIRRLFDIELLENNPRETHIKELKKELKSYIENKKSISRYAIEKGSNVKIVKVEGVESTSVKAYFSVKDGSEFTPVYELFILRKDENDKWRIYGWNLIQAEEGEFE